MGWALETNPEAMIAEREGRAAPSGSAAEELCRRARCPVLVIHGSDDRCQPVARGRRLAELTSGTSSFSKGIAQLIGTCVDYVDVETDGAARAAQLIAELI